MVWFLIPISCSLHIGNLQLNLLELMVVLLTSFSSVLHFAFLYVIVSHHFRMLASCITVISYTYISITHWWVTCQTYESITHTHYSPVIFPNDDHFFFFSMLLLLLFNPSFSSLFLICPSYILIQTENRQMSTQFNQNKRKTHLAFLEPQIHSWTHLFVWTNLLRLLPDPQRQLNTFLDEHSTVLHLIIISI